MFFSHTWLGTDVYSFAQFELFGSNQSFQLSASPHFLFFHLFSISQNSIMLVQVILFQEWSDGKKHITTDVEIYPLVLH